MAEVFEKLWNLHQHLGQQHADAVKKCDDENAAGRSVAVGVHIISKQRNVRHQAPHPKKRHHSLFRSEIVDEFIQREVGESNQVNSQENQCRQNESEHQPQLQVVTVKKKCSSLFQAAVLIYSV